MLTALYSAKGAPGVTSSALVLAAVWPRPVVVIEADPTGGDLAYRCRATGGGQLAASPNVLGLVAALRGERQTDVSEWAQPLACGVNVVAGVQSPAQARGIGDLWRRLAVTAAAANVDVIADLGRIDRNAPTMPLLTSADVRVPVLAASLDSIVHTRAHLLDVLVDGGRTMPLVLGKSRTVAADARDVDEVLAQGGVIAAPAAYLPLDHPGLSAIEGGASPAGRGRGSQLVRAARTVAGRVLESAGAEVPA